MASSTVKKANAQEIAARIRDSGANNREQLARDIADNLTFTSSYSEDQFVADATSREMSPQEAHQAARAFQENPSEPSTPEAEYLGESAREGRGHPGSGVA